MNGKKIPNFNLVHKIALLYKNTNIYDWCFQKTLSQCYLSYNNRIICSPTTLLCCQALDTLEMPTSHF